MTFYICAIGGRNIQLPHHFIQSWPPSLRHRRFRLLWTGLLISMAGSRMQTAAILWHVHQLNEQPIALGLVGLVGLLPIILLSLVAGSIADRLNRRKLIFFTQISMALVAGVLSFATFLQLDSLLLIYALIALNGAVASFDLPARQALVPNLLPRELLTNAFSMNSIAFQFGSVAGPGLAGLVLANWGLAYAYLINALSFLAVILALVRMGPVEQEIDLAPRSMHASVVEGLRFVVGKPLIFSSMLLDFFATFFSSAIFLLPIFATQVLGVEADGYGWLVAAPSIGALIVALPLALVRKIARQGALLLVSVFAFGLATIVFGFSQNYLLTFLALAATGATDTVSMVIRNTIRQIQTPDRLRGRMTSVNQIFFAGGPQLGELEAGLVAQWFNPPVAVISGGIACLLAVLGIAARYPSLRKYSGEDE